MTEYQLSRDAYTLENIASEKGAKQLQLKNLKEALEAAK